MATAKKQVSKKGEVSYRIRAFSGYDITGKQVERSTTWKPDPKLSEKAIEKELQRQIILFEEKVKQGQLFSSSTTFSEYATTWLSNNAPPQLAPKTYERYTSLLGAIDQAIGHIRLDKLQSQHLLAFYKNLREVGINKRGAYAIEKNLRAELKKRKIAHEKLAEMSGLALATVSASMKKGTHISVKSANKISTALGTKPDKLFTFVYSDKGLSDKTILHHHRLISVILGQATRDRLIPYNIADRNYIKAPRVARKEADFLEDFEAQQVITALAKEPLKWRAAIMLLIYSGMRRGELMGLEWKDIDFKNKIIHIRRTSQYTKDLGVITKDTKTLSSVRAIKLPDEAFQLLEEYKSWWEETQKNMGNLWHYNIEVTYVDASKSAIPNDRLFIQNNSTPMNPDSLSDWTRKFVAKYNLPKFTPHALRHTNASLLIANGLNIPTVSKRLGHSSIATTTKIYSHAIQSADAIAADILSEKLNPIKKLDSD